MEKIKFEEISVEKKFIIPDLFGYGELKFIKECKDVTRIELGDDIIMYLSSDEVKKLSSFLKD